MWLSYSHNKEDIWIAAVPVPIRSSVGENVSADHAKSFRIFQESADVSSGRYTLSVDGQITDKPGFMVPVSNISRLEFRTGRYRLKDFTRRACRPSKQPVKTYLEGADETVPLAVLILIMLK